MQKLSQIQTPKLTTFMADATVKEPEVNLELALEHRLNEEEFEKELFILRRKIEKISKISFK